MNKLQIKQAVIVEGRYDRAVLESVIDAVIIPVNGFGVYKDKKKLHLIKKYAESAGVILLTDSDNAGRQIRNYLSDCLSNCDVYHVYVPNALEVEDTSVAVLREAFVKFRSSESPKNKITREDLFDCGLIGKANSSKKRKELLAFMDLPENLSVSALINLINKCALSAKEYEKFFRRKGMV
ncbi:MAG: DUF4093 domain-containing protein [Oscillospiraceae bacterium]|nr:DUF4093 domain-containing protein [Oscillospiraceae bacterium]